ncbi:competence protein ComK [Pontibacillus sp. HMF3514]|uniref:competence protein ComK n=1 Tax=Pontibacillus sp. HMF3514 TaxID=2692425 RepID=UPI00131FA04A|nr:competence protein ComK [Pontibacillus sp. HMF3514]QHE53709.1 competence protein [Pontibacillus sp. HMF3514]
MTELKSSPDQNQITLGPTTMAIARMKDEYYGARIMDEIEGEILVKEIPLELIQSLCKTYLCTYEGLRRATALVLGYEKKTPILIHSEEGIYTCPTLSPYAEDCIWLFPRHIKKLEKINSTETKVIFKNNNYITVPVSLHTLEKQIQRTAYCAFYMKG